MKQLRALPVAFAIVAVAGSALADPRPVRWGEFVTIMQGNTLSGKTAAGKIVNLYFLPGGGASYEEVGGERGRGTWQLDKDGDVCVAWIDSPDNPGGCYQVTIDGSKVAWKSKDAKGSGTLRGGISETFLKPAAQ
jgi:hypothetical protein